MKDKVLIGNRWVGLDEPTFVIAEIGSNHNRNLELAKRHIEAAAQAGADAVKFQLYKASDLYAMDSSVYEMVKATELPPDWLFELKDFSNKQGLLFFASAFSEETIDLLAEVDIPAYKCASSETVKLDLLKYMASKKKPVLISTGMCDLADIFEAIQVVCSEDNTDIILMQCTSLYPTEPTHVHLRTMDTMRAAFQCPVGFSDHTLDIIIPVAAVARGASVVEKHMTLDRNLPGPDHSYALEPIEFKRMVDAIRATEQALGTSVKTMLPEEGKYARRDSLRAARDIEAGETLTSPIMNSQRPGDGIRPRYISAVSGCKTKNRIRKGEAINWDCITVNNATQSEE
jgi:N,N'-diacetyllegionaminate synthase